MLQVVKQFNIHFSFREFWKLDFNCGKKTNKILIKIAAETFTYFYYTERMDFSDFKTHLDMVKERLTSLE